MYVYQYMDSSDVIVFRYDNTGHHKKLNLSTHPHHKHEGSDDNVVPSAAKDLANILKEKVEIHEYALRGSNKRCRKS
ncbi:conserved hypothetical protein [Candidatus Brocadia pituitae]|nr:conserved hypothetical protein [Candidatus Brocadia pituitae]